MKTLIFTTSNDLNFDQRMQRICSSLQKAGFNCLLTGRVLKTSLPLKEQVFDQHRFKCFFNKGKFFYLELNIRLFYFLKKQKADLVCAVDFDTLPGAFNGAKNIGSLIVLDSHEYFEEVPELISRPRIKAIWERIGKKYIHKLDMAYTVNKSIADIYQEKYNIEFEVVRNLPIKNIEKDDANLHSNIILYQGALNKGRGLEQCIEAMKDFPNLEMHIAGEGDLSQELRVLVANLNLSNQVKFLGFVRPTELKKITKKALIGINVLKADSLNYYYSLANKFFDYMHAGIPHISMDFPEYKRINDDIEIAVLIKELSVAEIKNAIHKLTSDTSYYQRLKSNCKIAKDNYHWANEEKKLISIYNKLLESHP